MKASDIMTQPVITVTPDTPVADVAQLLLERHISAVPVVEGDRAIGIVSEGDLIRRIESGSTERTSWWLRAFGPIERMADDYVKAHGLTARDVMSSPIIGVNEDTPVPEIANILESRRIKRVPVMRGDQVVGVVSRANLLQAVAAGRRKLVAGEVEPSDTEIRKLILERVKSHPWAGSMVLNATVNDGVVELWGLVANDSQRDAVRVVAERTKGVREVVDHLQSFDPRQVRPE
jgi:CBS domain-containing protein